MKYTIKSRIWIEIDGEILLGEGRIRLLKAIAKVGSLSKAAQSLGMSYKKAWNLVDSMNSRSQTPLVETAVGGSHGGGSALTPYAIEMIATYEKITHNCWDFLDQQLDNSLLNGS